MITITDEAVEQIRQMQGEIADLRHEAGMYQSLYEASQKRVEELRFQLGKATQITPEMIAAAQTAIARHPHFNQSIATAFGFANTALKAALSDD